MTRGEPYGETILDDAGRGPHPQNPGDRAYEYGNTITLGSTGVVEAGEFVSANGDGTVTPLGTDPSAITDGDVDGIARHSFDPAAGDDDPARPDDGVAVHLEGVIRVGIDPGVAEVTVLDEVEDDFLVRL